ncbi:hypothetical protein CALVIDRAFT_525838 [Calocera viscosa TUFC12733]|uniref:C2H2-type domain-containing protein n=1 Tax=Calocera viscosa (strain TUFC12733) TaxID=1330018 RepID=A0A167PJS7_CALVF|nr:hypothetical protein CALVIDRAFT_525838 [Calocera viscosa TUFC12733]
MTMFVTKSSHGLVSLLNDDSDVPAQPPTHNASNMTGETKQQGALSSGLSNRQCLICARIFSTSGHLTRHSTVHTHEQKYGCPFPNCHKRCSRMDNLTQHYRAHVGHPSKMSNSVVRHRMDIMRAEQQDVDMVEREPDDSNHFTHPSIALLIGQDVPIGRRIAEREECVAFSWRVPDDAVEADNVQGTVHDRHLSGQSAIADPLQCKLVQQSANVVYAPCSGPPPW